MECHPNTRRDDYSGKKNNCNEEPRLRYAHDEHVVHYMFKHPPDPKAEGIGAQAEAGKDSTCEDGLGAKCQHCRNAIAAARAPSLRW